MRIKEQETRLTLQEHDDDYDDDDDDDNMRKYDEAWLEACRSWMNRTVKHTSVSLRLDSSHKN